MDAAAHSRMGHERRLSEPDILFSANEESGESQRSRLLQHRRVLFLDQGEVVEPASEILDRERNLLRTGPW